MCARMRVCENTKRGADHGDTVVGGGATAAGELKEIGETLNMK